MKAKFLNILLRAWKVVLGIAAIFLLIIWSTGALKEKTAPGTSLYDAGLPVPAGSATLTITLEPVPATVTVAGTVTSEDHINVSARTGGVIEEITVVAGDRVSKDQLLVRIDDREIRQQRAAAEAQLRRAATELERTRRLLEQEAATRQQFTDAETAHDAARARFEQINVVLSYHEVRSPIDGVITDRRIEQGDLAAPGQSLLAVFRPSAMRLDAPVPVRLIDRLATGQPVRVVIDELDRPVNGIVTEIASEVDQASRTRMVKVRLEDVAAAVMPGAFGRLMLELDTQDGIRIPATAVLRVGQLEMVSVIQNGRAVRRMIRTGPRQDGLVEVLSGLSAGEVVLLQPRLDP
jgi:RND family efflux transporter MFP subunit